MVNIVTSNRGNESLRNRFIVGLLNFKKYHQEQSCCIEDFGKIYVQRQGKRVDFGSSVYLPRNATLAALASLMGYDVLFVGDPGTGKSSLSKKLAAVLFGLPYNFMSAMEIRCTPEITEEKMIGRLDYGKLQAGEEYVIFNTSLALPVIIFDELNRLLSQSMAILLQGFESNVWVYLNQVLENTTNRRIFATINYPDEGNSQLIQPVVDRFSLVLELGWSPAVLISSPEKTRASMMELCIPEDKNQELVEKLQTLARNKSLTEERVSSLLAQYRLPRSESILSFTEEELNRIVEEIRSVKMYSTYTASDGADVPLVDAYLFLSHIEAEINYSSYSGFKRSIEEIEPSQQQRDRQIGHYVTFAYSPRAKAFLEDLVRAVAWLAGRDVVSITDVLAVAPYVLSYRLMPNLDYLSSMEGVAREESLIIAGTKKMLLDSLESFEDSSLVKARNEIIKMYQEALKELRSSINVPEGEEQRANLASQIQGSGNINKLLSLKIEDYQNPAIQALIIGFQDSVLSKLQRFVATGVLE